MAALFILGVLFFIFALVIGVFHLKFLKNKEFESRQYPIAIFIVSLLLIGFSTLGIILGVIGLANG